MKFENKIVLVTGGARGIGRAIVQAFAREGALVLFTYKDSEAGALQLEAELREAGGSCQSFALDVADHSAVQTVIEEAIGNYERIDILINNAGVTEDGFLMLMDEGAWDKVMDTNLKGAFNCCKAVIPSMLGNRRGAIVNISSISALTGVSSQTNYSASKAGLLGFTRSLSKEMAGKNIRVNAVAPGYIATDMLAKVPSRVRGQFMERIACGRVGSVDEVADVVLFLASEQASYIHGQTIVVDGGIL